MSDERDWTKSAEAAWANAAARRIVVYAYAPEDVTIDAAAAASTQAPGHALDPQQGRGGATPEHAAPAGQSAGGDLHTGPGGVRARPEGQGKGAAAGGMYGGEGQAGDHGVPSGVALFGGLVGIPAALKGRGEREAHRGPATAESSIRRAAGGSCSRSRSPASIAARCGTSSRKIAPRTRTRACCGTTAATCSSSPARSSSSCARYDRYRCRERGAHRKHGDESQSTNTQAESPSMAISWPLMEQRGPQVTEAQIEAFERAFGHRLPDDYRQFLLNVNGGRPDRANRELEQCVVNCLFSLDDTSDESSDLATQASWSRPTLPSPDLLYIGFDGYDGSFLLALAGEHRGEVWRMVDGARLEDANPRVLWHDRRDMQKLASSFEQFMRALRPRSPLCAQRT